jgi:hypothetical protein
MVELKNEAQMPVAKLRQGIASQVEHLSTGNGEAACVGLAKCAHNLEQRGFARSAGSYNAYYFAAVNVKTHIVEYIQRAKRFIDGFEVNHEPILWNRVENVSSISAYEPF